MGNYGKILGFGKYYMNITIIIVVGLDYNVQKLFNSCVEHFRNGIAPHGKNYGFYFFRNPVFYRIFPYFSVITEGKGKYGNIRVFEKIKSGVVLSVGVITFGKCSPQ